MNTLRTTNFSSRAQNTTSLPKNLLCLATTCLFALTATGCGTLTGIPSHGGGKRFSEEQRLVSASIRSTLKQIDVSPLRGKKVAIIFDMISDEGGGNISGGRFNLLAGLTTGYLASPITTTNGQFQLFNVIDTGTNYQNTATGVNGTMAGLTTINTNSAGQTLTDSTGASTSTSSSNTTGSNSSIINNGAITTTNSGSQSSTTNIGASTTNSSGNSGVTTNIGASTTTGSGNASVKTNIGAVTTDVSGSSSNTFNNPTTTTTINNPATTLTIDNPAISTTTNYPVTTTNTTINPGKTTTTTGTTVTTQETAQETTAQTTLANAVTQSTLANTVKQSTLANTVTQSTEANTATSSGKNTGTSTTNASTNTQSSTADNSSTTGASTNTQTGTQTGTSTTGASTNTAAGTTTGIATTGTQTNTQEGTQTSQNSQNGSGTNTSSSTQGNTSKTDTGQAVSENRTSDQKEDSKGGNEVKRQVLSPEAVSKQQQTKGHEFNASATLQYKGLGDYTNMAIPKSDASLLTGLTRTYLLLNEIEVTTPTDPTAEAVLYVAVDIFGIVRSRFDAYVLNQESVKAETGMEMTAFDRSGKMIMRPRNANQEAGYNEIYLFWAGPFASDEQIKPGKGLLDDFSDVVPGKTNYIKKKERTNFGPIDNNKDELDELDNLF